MDTSKVGIVAAQLMEHLADDADPSEDEQIGEVLLLAEVRGKDQDGNFTYISWRCSDEREWVQRGMLHAALDQKRVTEPEGDED